MQGDSILDQWFLLQKKHHQKHGRSYCLTLDCYAGVVSCAVIMSLSTIEVIQSSSMDLVSGLAYGALLNSFLGLLKRSWVRLALHSL